MFAVYAAEQQYRHDTWSRDRELTRLASIRERGIAVASRRPRAVRVEAPAERPQRTGWARPIGLHTQEECPAAVAC